MSDAPAYSRRKVIVGVIAGIVVFAALVSVSISQYAQIAVLQTDKNYLQDQVHSLQDDKTFLQNQIQNLQDSIDRLNTEKSIYEGIANFSQSTNIFPLQNVTLDASMPSFRAGMNLEYAGYLDVSLNSTSNSTYVVVTYSSVAGDFSFQKTFGPAGKDIFFVLPTPMMRFIIGSTEASAVNVTFSVTYYY